MITTESTEHTEKRQKTKSGKNIKKSQVRSAFFLRRPGFPFLFSVCSVLSVVIVLLSQARGADWPQFLGPERNSTSTETGLLQTWDAKGPAVLWQKEVGEGYSAPVAAGG